MNWTVQVEEDSDGNAILPFTEEMLELLGWKEGDQLLWSDNGDGTWILTKHVDSDS